MKKIILLLSVYIALSNVSQAQVVSPAGQMSVPRWNQQSQKLNNGTVLTFGGDDGNYATQVTYASAEIYNSGTWSVTGSMHIARTNFASVLLTNGKVLAIGGESADASSVYASCEIYDPSTSQWSYTDSLPTGYNAEESAVVLSNGKVLVAGGYNGDTALLYNSTVGTWSKTGVLTDGHGSFITLVLLQSGKVLAVGGDGCLSCGDVYDPSTGQWTELSSQTIFPRENSAGLLLNSGKVLISGSTTFNDDAQTTSELFDPATNQFDTSAGRLLTNVGDDPTVLLDNGNALLWGLGNFFDPTNTDVVQIYNAATDNWFALTTDFIGSQANTIVKLSNNQVLVIGGSSTTLNGADAQAWLINGNAIPSAAGIINIANSVDIAIAPNPGSDYFNIKTQHPEDISRIDIYDVQGKLLKEVRQHFDTPVQTADLLPGVYLMLFYNQSGNASAFQKWIKQ